MSEKVKRYFNPLNAASWRGEAIPDGVYVLFTDYEAAERKIEQQAARIKELDQHLSNLLAMIHGDGGHYQAEHGTAKAVEGAIQKNAALKVRIGELEARVGELTLQQTIPLSDHMAICVGYEAKIAELVAEIRILTSVCRKVEEKAERILKLESLLQAARGCYEKWGDNKIIALSKSGFNNFADDMWRVIERIGKVGGK